jgi:Ser/Thr protein kinase RdoA (MazF antagonist)
MDIEYIKNLLSSAYGFETADLYVTSLGNGLINSTWKVTTIDAAFVFQKINTSIFKDPVAIDNNLRLIAEYLKNNYPGYLFPGPLKNISGNTLTVTSSDEYFRLLPFVKNSHAVDVVQTPDQAYKAAALFGAFTKRLAALPANKLNITLPRFHDLPLRFNQFKQAVQNANGNRIKKAATLIETATEYAGIVSLFEKLVQSKILQLRPAHHDTKISNVLFDDTGAGLCVIDFDTVMPGYFISDTGDMLRTMLSPVSEEEKDLKEIQVRDDFYQAIYHGYMDAMKDEMDKEEQQQFFFSGMYMIYMQGLRFLTDHINNDIYYGAAYPGHNYNRAANQFTLLQLLLAKRQDLMKRYSFS